MLDKYEMTQEQNIEIAKRLLVDAIYKSANLEGIAVTYAQTNDILNNVAVPQITPNEIMKVCCLRDSWHYLLDHINDDMHLGYLENIHSFVAKADVPYYELGRIRHEDVLISGTNWRPELPDPEKLHRELSDIMSMDCCTDKAITLMLWAMRNQIFKDGNKRVATLAANKVLIEEGRGVIQIPVELDGAFKQMLVEYYETNDMSQIKPFIYENCMNGLNEIKRYPIQEELTNTSSILEPEILNPIEMMDKALQKIEAEEKNAESNFIENEFDKDNDEPLK